MGGDERHTKGERDYTGTRREVGNRTSGPDLVGLLPVGVTHEEDTEGKLSRFVFEKENLRGSVNYSTPWE